MPDPLPTLVPGIRYRVAPPGAAAFAGTLVGAGLDPDGNPSHLWLEPPLANATDATGPILFTLGPGTLVWPVPPLPPEEGGP